MMLEEVGAHIGAEIESQGEGILDALVVDLVAGGGLRELLDSLLKDELQLGRIASRSYAHQNGYDRISLFESRAPEFGLRLHAWWAAGKTAERPHSHPWNFGSILLCGTLRCEILDESSQGRPFYSYMYDRPVASVTYPLRRAGITNLQQRFVGDLPAGTRYLAHQSLIHRVWLASPHPVVTLMLHGAGTAYPSRVFSEVPLGPGDRVSYPAPRFEAAVLVEDLQRIRSIIA